MPQWAWAQPSNSSNPQVLCFGSQEPYCVDCPAASPNGTPGSTYAWSVISGPFAGSITVNPAFPSQNHILIDWAASPADDYVLQVIETNAQGCAGDPMELNIQITPEVTPIFAAVGPFCTGSPIAALPTTSTNGITGSWTPAINNTATTTYTFTPDAGQCATTTTLVITISTLPEVTVNSEAICFGADASITATPTVLGTYDYAWTVPAGAADPGNVATFTATVAGNYTVTISTTGTSPCSSLPASGTLTVNPEITTTGISHN